MRVKSGKKGTREETKRELNQTMATLHYRRLPFVRSSPSLRNLEPVLRLMNHSVVESIARATAGLNVTLLDGAARRRGGRRHGPARRGGEAVKGHI